MSFIPPTNENVVDINLLLDKNQKTNPESVNPLIQEVVDLIFPHTGTDKRSILKGIFTSNLEFFNSEKINKIAEIIKQDKRNHFVIGSLSILGITLCSSGLHKEVIRTQNMDLIFSVAISSKNPFEFLKKISSKYEIISKNFVTYLLKNNQTKILCKEIKNSHITDQKFLIDVLSELVKVDTVNTRGQFNHINFKDFGISDLNELYKIAKTYTEGKNFNWCTDFTIFVNSEGKGFDQEQLFSLACLTIQRLSTRGSNLTLTEVGFKSDLESLLYFYYENQIFQLSEITPFLKDVCHKDLPKIDSQDLLTIGTDSCRVDPQLSWTIFTSFLLSETNNSYDDIVKPWSKIWKYRNKDISYFLSYHACKYLKTDKQKLYAGLLQDRENTCLEYLKLPVIALMQFLDDDLSQIKELIEITDLMKKNRLFFKDNMKLKIYLEMIVELFKCIANKRLSNEEAFLIIKEAMKGKNLESTLSALFGVLKSGRIDILKKNFFALGEVNFYKIAQSILNQIFREQDLDSLNEALNNKFNTENLFASFFLYACNLTNLDTIEEDFDIEEDDYIDSNSALTLLADWAISVNKGTYKHLRYSDSFHLDTVFGKSKNLKDKWVKGAIKPLKVTESDHSLSVDYFGFFKTKILVDKHLAHKDFSYIVRFLESEKDIEIELTDLMNNTEIIFSESDISNLTFQKRVIEFLQTKHTLLQDNIFGIEKILNTLKNAAPLSQLNNDLIHLLKSLKKSMKKQNFEGYTIEDTDDPMKLFGCGIGGSCQSHDSSIEYNIGLLGYLLNGNRMLVVTDKDGQMVARAILRLLYDENDNFGVLMQERTYSETLSAPINEAINQFAIERSKDLGLLLYKEGKDTKVCFKSLSGKAPDYVDSIGPEIHRDGAYTVKTAKLIYDPEIMV